MTLDFGYLPEVLNVKSEKLSITTLPDLEEKINDIQEDQNLRKGWVYPGNQRTRHFGVGETIEPYSSRVFGLPNTHSIKHSSDDNPIHLKFHVWVISFFKGIRLTTTEAGFLDSTPIKTGTLVDFIPMGPDELILELSEKFWHDNQTKTIQLDRFCAAIHALFISQNPQYLQFEQFLYLYTALDACFAILWEGTSGRNLSHAERLEWMCEEKLNANIPEWALSHSNRCTEVSTLRNNMLHEAIYIGEPLGFAIQEQENNRNLTLEMEALTCRLLAKIIGVSDDNYLQSALDTPQRYPMHLEESM